MQEEKISRSVMKQDEEDKAAGTVEEEDEVVLPGFRFHPTDEELVGFYLRRKVEKKIISIGIIKQIDIYKYDPWDLPKVSTAGEKEWYFFCLREKKYKNSVRPNRVTGSGFWKATGIDKPINSSEGRDKCIGLKKSLVYYRGSAGKGTKTDWMMHEFRLPSESMQAAEIWTICRIFKKDVTYKKNLAWRESSSREQTQILNTDSSSKSSSFESDGSDTYYKKHFGSSTVHQGEKLVRCHLERPAESVADQWNTTTQPPLATSHLEISSPIVSELYKDANNWDELGRIMESVMDPAMVYEYCRYT